MAKLEDYQVDHLFLLIGTNPLPNYVAAKLLTRAPQATNIWLVHSSGTRAARDALQSVLHSDGFTSVQSFEVKEADGANISSEVKKRAEGLSGRIGLNYTGGTKAMSVHAYRTLESLKGLHVQFSYLDARSLDIQIEGYAIGTTVSIPTEDQIALQVERLLELHSRERPKLERLVFWPQLARAIAEIHADQQSAEQWQAWIAKTFFVAPSWPQESPEGLALSTDEWQTWVCEQFVYREYLRRTWAKKRDRDEQRLSLPPIFQLIQGAIETDLVGKPATTLGELRRAGRFKEFKDLGKWLEGGWLESYVMQQVLVLQEQGTFQIADVARNLRATISIEIGREQEKLRQDIELDVAFTRGYQLFVLSCSTTEAKDRAKSKLLEAVARAGQVGGAEARVALVCCSAKPRELEKEIVDVLGRRVRVFGRSHLPDLQTELANWITDVSGSQE